MAKRRLLPIAAAALAAAATLASAVAAAEEISGKHPLEVAAAAPKYFSLNPLDRQVVNFKGLAAF